MRKLRKIAAGLSLVCLLVFTVGVLWSTRHGMHYLSVQSGSMMPALAVGDVVVTQPKPQYAVGDVVTYKNTQQVLVTHRIVAVDEPAGTITTKGDANQTPDEPIRPRQIVGTVQHVLPHAGWLVTGSRPMLWVAAMVYIPALFILGWEVVRLSRYFAGEPETGSYSYVHGIRLPRPKYYRQGSGVIGVVAVMAMGAALVAPTSAQINDSARLAGNTITASIPQQYTVCQFPGNEALLSYALEDAYFPELPDEPIHLQQPILPGKYRVEMASHDTHTSIKYQVTQLNERWFFQLSNGEGEVVAVSDPTDDLPNSADSNTTTVNLDLQDTATGIRYVHEAAKSGLEINNFGGRRFDDLSYTEKRQVIWNSIHPGCITLTREFPSPAPTNRD